jgi:hypothetical protein
MNSPVIYNVKTLKFYTYPDTKVFIKFKSKKNPKTNFEGVGKIKSNQLDCCFITTPKTRFFILYYDDCINNEAKTVELEREETLEIFDVIHRKQAAVSFV